MNKFWRVEAECLIAALALTLLTAICDRLHFNLTTISLLYVIVVVLIARVGNFVSSIFASIIATLCMAYVAPPAFSFRIDDPLNYVATIAFLFSSLTIAGLVSRVRKQAEDALSSVSYRVIEGEERERRRTADELHEDIGQRLSLLVSEIERAKTDTTTVEMSNSLDEVSKRILEILADVTILANDLYSPRLEFLGTAAIMTTVCRDFAKRRGVQIDFSSDGLPSRSLPPDVSLCLIRVLQEALHNALRHSGVRHFNGRLWGTSDEVHLTVSDCGVGISLEAARKAGGLGLNRMQERLKLVNGTLSIESQLNAGATIHARVLLPPKTKSAKAVS
jgi:signal transduction histidine kinase